TVKTLESIVSDAPCCRITFPWTITVSTTSQFFPSGTSTVSWVPDNGPSHLVTAAAALLVPAINAATEIAIDKKSRLIVSCVGFIFVASFSFCGLFVFLISGSLGSSFRYFVLWGLEGGPRIQGNARTLSIRIPPCALWWCDSY